MSSSASYGRTWGPHGTSMAGSAMIGSSYTIAAASSLARRAASARASVSSSRSRLYACASTRGWTLGAGTKIGNMDFTLELLSGRTGGFFFLPFLANFFCLRYRASGGGRVLPACFFRRGRRASWVLAFRSRIMLREARPNTLAKSSTAAWISLLCGWSYLRLLGSSEI